jgi:hypothetical protein
MTVFPVVSFVMISQEFQPEFSIFGAKEANHMQMYVFGAIERGKISLTTNMSGKNRLQIGQRSFAGRLIFPFARFFTVFPDEHSIQTAFDQSRAKDPEGKIQPNDCVGAGPNDILNAGIGAINDPVVSFNTLYDQP